MLIYSDDVDRERFFRLLTNVTERFSWRCLAWCLLGTHYHLLVEAGLEQVSAGMHRLNGIYAQGFNRRHGRRGHLFEERFSAWIVNDDPHLEATLRYILENPMKAGLCRDSRDWFWGGPARPCAVVLP